ncbi:MAG: efflux RND transporter permease subunit [Alphaproteobacteria bacterium]|nr:efflux RND transporter permease subunit [Alphaproteobacteria bacterium]
MNAFIAAALSRSRTVISILFLCIIWGIIAYAQIPKESTPDVKIPIIYVSLVHEGISPQDAQRLLLRPLEQELHNIEGVKKMTSTAYENGGNIILEFTAGFNSERARYDVRDRVDLAKVKLPLDTKEPTISEINLSLFPVLIVKISGKIPLRTLYRMARELRDEIEGNVTSVRKAEIMGDQNEIVEILIDPTQVEGYGLAFDQVIANFTENNQIIPAGNIEMGTGRFAVKVPGVLEDILDIMQLPVATNNDAVIRLKDIAEVRRTFKDRESIVRDRGVPAVSLEISKRTGENLIQTIENVKAIVEAQKKKWPDHVSVSYANDQSNQIRDMLNDLQNSIILAIILVMGIIVYSLGWRSSLLVGISVPGSFLMGVMIISMMGLTINIVVLFSLIFAVGMLVDGAIIVVEYADLKISEGMEPRAAYLHAAQRMAWPVITSIVTIIAVFMPLLFWPGVPGQFMKFMPITLIAVLTASILMALVFVPAIGQMLKPSFTRHHAPDTALEKPTGLMAKYLKALNFALDYPKRIIGGAIAILILAKMTYSTFGRGVEFFPDVEPEIVAIHVHGRGNLSIMDKDHLVHLVENKILPMKELKSVYVRTGTTMTSSNGGTTTEDTIGTITLEFIDWRKRRPANDILNDIEKSTKDIPGVHIEIQKEDGGPPGQKPIDIEISAPEAALLKPALLALRKYVEELPGITSITDNLPIPGIEWQLTVDRSQAAKFNASIRQVGNAIKLVTNGVKVAAYRPEDALDEVDIVVRYFPQYRVLDELDKLKIQTSAGLMPLSNFVTRTPEQKVSKIDRVNRKQILSLKADVLPGFLAADKIQEIRTALPNLNLDPRVSIKFMGEEQDRQESMVFLMQAFFVAIFMIAVILITQFNSFFSTGLVLSAVVLSSIGIFIGILIHGMAFGIVMGGIGVIALAGIIVSNNILLIDTYDLLISQISNPTLEQYREVIIRTCMQRVRPVILTKLATILGLLPIMLGINIDFINLDVTIGAPSTQWWRLLSVCIVYGVLFASSLTLLVTPAALMWRAQRKTRKKPKRIKRTQHIEA